MSERGREQRAYGKRGIVHTNLAILDHVSSRSRVITILYYLCLCRRVERKRRVIPRLRALNRREEGTRVDCDQLVAWWIGHRLHGIDAVDKVDGELGVFWRVELLILQNKGCERVYVWV